MTSTQQERTPTWWANHVELVTQIVAAVAVLAGIAATVFGVSRNEAANTSDARVAQLERQLGAANEENGRLESRATAAEAEAKRLRDAAAAAPSPAPSSSQAAPAPAPAAGVRRSAPLVIGVGQSADLDNLDDPQWETLGSDGVGDRDLISRETYFRPYNAAGVIVDASVAPTDCPAALGFTFDSVPIEKIRPGVRICIKTSEDRFAQIQVKAREGNGSITFDVTVLNGPED